MSVGEVALTLQDVSCLWGLLINSHPIVGWSEGDAIKLIKDSFGIDLNAHMMKLSKRKTRENQEEIIIHSGFKLSLKWLWRTF